MKKAHTLSFIFSKRIPRSRRAFLKDFAMRLPSRALALLDPPERKSFLEHEIRQAFGFRRVEILSRPEGPERFSPKSTEVRDLLGRVQGALDGLRTPFLNLAIAKELGVAAILVPLGATYVFPIRQRELTLGILVIDSTPETQLAGELEQVLLHVCAQAALVLDNSQLLAAKLRLQDKLAQQAQMAQLGEMTARIAHEIKNPLSSIKTIVQVMQEDATVQGKYSTDLRLIIGEIDRLGASVAQLLNFARPDPGPRGSVRLQELTGSVIEFLRRDIEQIAAVVENQIPDDLPQVVGSAAAHREILLNLLLNALQAGGKGTHVWVQAWEGILEDGSERFVLIVVEDDGPGISAEAQRRIFEPFFTTKQRGTGLGLAIVKRNVEYYGGRITVESPAREGRGTRFLMHLPLA
jgi:signal transduction histidine kinase